MKALKYLSFLALFGVVGIGSVWAHGTRIGVGMYFGPPIVSPWYGGYPPPAYYYRPYSPYYYPPQVVVVPAPQPPVYIEQSGALPPPPAPAAPAPQAAPSDQTTYWYYCEAPQAYYPYVKECPEGWLRVTPQTAPPSARR